MCRSDLVCVRVLHRSIISIDPSRRSDQVRVRVLLRSTVSISPSLNRVEPDLFLSLYLSFRSVLLRPTSSSTPNGTVTPSLDRGIDIQ